MSKIELAEFLRPGTFGQVTDVAYLGDGLYQLTGWTQAPDDSREVPTVWEDVDSQWVPTALPVDAGASGQALSLGVSPDGEVAVGGFVSQDRVRFGTVWHQDDAGWTELGSTGRDTQVVEVASSSAGLLFAGIEGEAEQRRAFVIPATNGGLGEKIGMPGHQEVLDITDVRRTFIGDIVLGQERAKEGDIDGVMWVVGANGDLDRVQLPSMRGPGLQSLDLVLDVGTGVIVFGRSPQVVGRDPNETGNAQLAGWITQAGSSWKPRSLPWTGGLASSIEGEVVLIDGIAASSAYLITGYWPHEGVAVDVSLTDEAISPIFTEDEAEAYLATVGIEVQSNRRFEVPVGRAGTESAILDVRSAANSTLFSFSDLSGTNPPRPPTWFRSGSDPIPAAAGIDGITWTGTEWILTGYDSSPDPYLRFSLRSPDLDLWQSGLSIGLQPSDTEAIIELGTLADGYLLGWSRTSQTSARPIEWLQQPDGTWELILGAYSAQGRAVAPIASASLEDGSEFLVSLVGEFNSSISSSDILVTSRNAMDDVWSYEMGFGGGRQQSANDMCSDGRSVVIVGQTSFGEDHAEATVWLRDPAGRWSVNLWQDGGRLTEWLTCEFTETDLVLGGQADGHGVMATQTNGAIELAFRTDGPGWIGVLIVRPDALLAIGSDVSGSDRDLMLLLATPDLKTVSVSSVTETLRSPGRQQVQSAAWNGETLLIGGSDGPDASLWAVSWD